LSADCGVDVSVADVAVDVSDVAVEEADEGGWSSKCVCCNICHKINVIYVINGKYITM